MKIGRSSISVNVATPYTCVGHCDNARWMSVAVLVSLVGNELAQSFERIIAFCCILTARYAARMPFISRMPKSCLSPLSRNHCPTAPPPRSRKTAPSSNTPRPSTSLCHCRAPPHDDSRILPLSSKMVSDSKEASPKEDKTFWWARRILHEILALKATSVQFCG